MNKKKLIGVIILIIGIVAVSFAGYKLFVSNDIVSNDSNENNSNAEIIDKIDSKYSNLIEKYQLEE